MQKIGGTKNLWSFAAALSFVFFCLTACTKQRPAGNTVEPPRTARVLGTVCTVNAFDDGTTALYDSIFSRLEALDGMFNVHAADSELSAVNAAAGRNAVTVSDEVAYVLSLALDFAEESGGVFDPSIGPLVSAWGIGSGNERVPADEELAALMPLVDYKSVRVTGNSVFLEKSGMALDLGGIVKGYAADQIVNLLSGARVRGAVIDLGGNIYVYGSKKDGNAWRVGIKNPFEPEGEPALALTLDSGGTVVTSGVYERFFMHGGKRFHHIFDVSTGMSAERPWDSVTVVLPKSSLTADALSTWAFLSGPGVIAEEQKKGLYSGAGFVFIYKDGSVQASKSLEGALSAYQSGFSDISWF